MSRGFVSGLAVLGAGLLAAPARALCDAPRPAAPARVGPGPAGFGSLPEACPGTEVGLLGDAALLDAAAEDFYGSVVVGAAVHGRYALDERVWVSAWLPGPQLHYVANATVETSSIELGPTAFGVHVSLPVTERSRLAPYARALVPTETIYRNATRYGFDHGLSFGHRLSPRLDVLGGAAFPLLLVDGSGTLHPSFQPFLRAEVAYTAFRWLTVNAGFALRLRGGDDAAFESFEPLLGLRFFPHRRVPIELGARLPLAGADRTDLGATLGAGYRFDAR